MTVSTPTCICCEKGPATQEWNVGEGLKSCETCLAGQMRMSTYPLHPAPGFMEKRAAVRGQAWRWWRLFR